MPHLNLQEQERINKLKYFWSDWGKYIVGILVVVLIAYASNVFWTWKNESQAAKASIIYEQFTNNVNLGNQNAVYSLAKQLEIEYPKVEYTALASIWAAKIAWSNKDVVDAILFLTWAINNVKDKGLVGFAKLRLATIYIDQEKFDQALKLLMEKHDPAFDIQYYTERGDLYVAKNDLAKARDAYKEAIQKAGQDTNAVQTIQLKLDVLGGS